MAEPPKASTNISLVDRVAERIAKSEVGAFITDDELLEIIRSAIDKAFFTPRTQGSGYNQSNLPPLIVELAQQAFTPLVKERVEKLVKILSNTPEFQTAVQEVAVASIPDLLLNYGRRLATETVSASARAALVAGAERARQGFQVNLDAEGQEVARTLQTLGDDNSSRGLQTHRE